MSRFNSAIALTVEQHEKVSRSQRLVGLYDEEKLEKAGAREILEVKARFLLHVGVPNEHVIALIDHALEQLPALLERTHL